MAHGLEQWKDEADREEIALRSIHKILDDPKYSENGLTAARIAVLVSLPVLMITKLLNRSKCVLKTNPETGGLTWIADWKDLEQFPTIWTSKDEALYVKRYRRHSRYHTQKLIKV